ncbi:pyridoxamine 5'-phosphate oxidase family protein [Telluribacter sp.]|jgi:general stress protein 26|uniref:pyridoxamine 5'-phosphate oxidase family protein n=1 Tax=Telluribacter sp. TaxID=1978767 RepID=UPI002E146029|nr:pyridoxamine 5'-phosphate oxidase family protein [Telluribacter sp.]
MKTEEVTHPDLKKIQDIVDDIKVAMITTMEANGDHRSRPMQTQKFDADGCLWFFTNEHSPKIDELQQHPNINVSYADKGSRSYVSITGTASVVDDAETKKELWNPILKAWFPKGLEDPELTLLKIQIKEAEYWDGSSSKMVQAYKIAKALATGDRYDQGENKKINL